MKKILLSLAALFIFNASANAATTIIENYDATKLKPGVHTFSVSMGYENTLEELKKDVMQEVKREFKPEFLNRIDDIIVFHKLNEKNIEKIIEIMLSMVEKRMKDKNIKIKFDKKIKELIAKKGTDINYGARPLKRAIQSFIEDKIAEEILNENIKEGDEAIITTNDNEVIIKVKISV